MDTTTLPQVEPRLDRDQLREIPRTGTPIGQTYGYTAVEVALAWLRHKPFPLVPIVGPATLKELVSCVKAISLALTDEEIKWLTVGNQ